MLLIKSANALKHVVCDSRNHILNHILNHFLNQSLNQEPAKLKNLQALEKEKMIDGLIN